MRKTVSSVMLVLLVTSMLAVGFSSPPLEGLPEMASNGRSFGITTRISDVYTGAYAMVATDTKGGVYATWYSFPTLELCFTYSHDGGKTWSNVTKLCGGVIGCSDPDVAVDPKNGYVYVDWLDNRTGHTDVYICGSVDRGVSFSSAIMVNNVEGSDIVSVDNGVSYSTHVAVADDGTVYVAWVDNRTNPSYSDIYLAKSTDHGQTFNTNTRVNPYEPNTLHVSPWITVDDAGIVYVAYTSYIFPESIYLTKSLDGGLTFKAPVKVNDDNTNSYRGKKEVVVSRSGEIYIVWTDGRGSANWNIYFATSLDGGLSFSPNVLVNDDNASVLKGTPSLAIDSQGGIHVVWEDFRNNKNPDWVPPGYIRDIYYAFSEDGKQFSKNVKVNYVPDATTVDCADPNIAIDSHDNFYIVFSDDPHDTDLGIYFAYSANVLSLETPKTVVGQGYNLSFNVIILDAGDVNETFNVTALGNTTIIGTQANVHVLNGTLATLNFTWNTTGLRPGNYIINALAGNASATSSIVVTVPGDIDGNFKVQLNDLVLLAQAYGSKPGDSKWNPNADIDSNLAVGLSDLVILAQHYGEQYGTQEQIRDAVMSYIETEHSETTQYMQNLSWTGGKTTSPGYIGAEWYSYASGRWNLTMWHPLIPNPMYTITAKYTVLLPLDLKWTTVAWNGTWLNGIIIETSYNFNNIPRS